MLKLSINKQKFSIFIVSINIVIIIIYNLVSTEPGSREFVKINQRYVKIEKLVRICKIGIYRSLKVLFPDDFELTLELGSMYKEDGKNEKAWVEIEKALKIGPTIEREYVDVGNIYLELGKDKEAEEMYKKAIKINPENEQTYAGLGIIYKNQNKNKEAEEMFKKAIKINPDNSQTYVDMGSLYEKQGKNKEAEEIYKKTLEINPENDQARNALSNIYLNEGMKIIEEAKKKH